MPTVTITIPLADATYLPMFLHNAADRTLDVADSLAESDKNAAADLRAEVSHLDRLADAISDALPPSEIVKASPERIITGDCDPATGTEYGTLS